MSVPAEANHQLNLPQEGNLPVKPAITKPIEDLGIPNPPVELVDLGPSWPQTGSEIPVQPGTEITATQPVTVTNEAEEAIRLSQSVPVDLMKEQELDQQAFDEGLPPRPKTLPPCEDSVTDEQACVKPREVEENPGKPVNGLMSPLREELALTPTPTPQIPLAPTPEATVPPGEATPAVLPVTGEIPAQFNSEKGEAVFVREGDGTGTKLGAIEVGDSVIIKGVTANGRVKVEVTKSDGKTFTGFVHPDYLTDKEGKPIGLSGLPLVEAPSSDAPSEPAKGQPTPVPPAGAEGTGGQKSEKQEIPAWLLDRLKIEGMQPYYNDPLKDNQDGQVATGEGWSVQMTGEVASVHGQTRVKVTVWGPGSDKPAGEFWIPSAGFADKRAAIDAQKFVDFGFSLASGSEQVGSLTPEQQAILDEKINGPAKIEGRTPLDVQNQFWIGTVAPVDFNMDVATKKRYVWGFKGQVKDIQTNGRQVTIIFESPSYISYVAGWEKTVTDGSSLRIKVLIPNILDFRLYRLVQEDKGGGKYQDKRVDPVDSQLWTVADIKSPKGSAVGSLVEIPLDEQNLGLVINAMQDQGPKDITIKTQGGLVLVGWH